MLETKLDRLVSRKVEELLNAMPVASGRRDYRRGQVRAYRGEEGVPGGPLRAGPDREGRHRDPEGPEAQGRAVRVGGDRIAIAIKLTDGGPIFYTQTRVGRRDKPFKMIKFRSMVVNADKMKAELAKETGQDGRFIIQNEGRSASHQGRQVYP